MQKKSIFKQYIMPIGGMTIFTVLTCIFLILCIPQFRTGFIHKHAIGILSTSLILSVLLFITMVITYFYHIDVVHKSIFTLLVCAAIALIVLYIMQRTGFYETINSKEKLEAWIKSFGAWPPVIYTVIQFLQVCVLPIPSTVTIGIGVYLFGVWWTMLYSFIGIMLGSLVAFYVGRFLGYKVVAWIVGRDDLDKWLKKLNGKDKVVLTGMFLLPLFPDDVLCFVAGLTKMSSSFFIVMQLVSRAIAIVLSCFALKGWIIPFNNWWGIMLWGIIFIAVIIAMVFLWKHAERLESWINKKFSKKSIAEQSVEATESTTETIDKLEDELEQLSHEGEDIIHKNLPPDKIE